MVEMKSKKTKILIILAIASVAAAGFAEEQDQLFSTLAARTFYNTGYELYNGKDAGFVEAKQAIIFFNVAINLDSRANYVLPDIINIAWKYPEENFSDVVQLALNEYVDRFSDLKITSKAVQYLLERLSSREEREQLLQKLLSKYQEKNQFFASDLAAQMGFLKAETANTAESQSYLMQAYSNNKYNKLAFDKLAELVEADGDNLPIISYLENFRYAVRVNPLDFEAAFDFARLAESLGLYKPAAAGYRYCVQLYKYLNPGKPLPAELYRPWMLSCYNAHEVSLCQQIMEEVRSYGVFDVMVESIAAASAKQSGDEKSSQAILGSIRRRAGRVLAGEVNAPAGELEDLTWFVIFAADVNDVNPEDALLLATKAYDAGSNSIGASSFFAYALAESNQIELAKPVIEKIGTSTQASAITKAEILIAEKDTDSAIKILKSAVEASPGTFEARRAKRKLKKLGSEYEPAFDPDAFITTLKNDFGQNFFSEFVPPEKMIMVELKTRGTAFSYESDINAELAIINNYSEPMVVCPQALFKGNIRVDIRLSGDLSEQIDSLIVKTVRPSHEIRPGQALFVPLQLVTDRLKQIMERHPQADLNLEAIAYIDPQVGPDGQIRNFYGIKPAKAVLKLKKLDLNTRYLQQRLDAIKKGHQGQKIKSAQLFAGLLAEQQSQSVAGPKYRFMYAEPQLLSSALARCLVEDDWVLKVETMASLLRLKLDYRLTEAVSAELHNRYWTVRLMAIFILAENQGKDFLSVLNWTANNDNSQTVKDMAAALATGISEQPAKKD
ncbi:MAG: hypothetical protein KJ757_06610 [Planctomycetes bacterium]|nr:hypothetical protein [Planctomycetota bacterium]